MVLLRSFARYWLLVSICLCCVTMQSQDPSLTNFHLVKNYLNPAFAGYSQDLSVSLDNRLQWVKISKFRQFNNYNMAANVGCESMKLGFGFYANNNVEGEGFLRTTTAGFQIARYWPFDYYANGSKRNTNSSIVSAGLQFGIGQKRLDWNELVFSDQLSNSTYQLVSNSSLVAEQNNVSEFRLDLGGGIRFQTELGKKNRSSLSSGIAFFHIFTNQESFFSDNSDITRPTRYTAHMFYTQPLGKGQNANWEGSIGTVFNQQAGVINFTVMTYASYDSQIRMGIGYRGKNQGFPDAIVIQPTFKGKNLFGKNDWLCTLSYEITSLSSVGYQRTSGTIEFGIVVSFRNTAICRDSDIDCYYPNKKMKEESIWNY